MARFFAVLSEHIDKSPGHYFVQGFVYIRMEAHVVQHRLGIVDVYRLRCDVQITHPEQGVVRAEVLPEVLQQSIEPFELVLKFLRIG